MLSIIAFIISLVLIWASGYISILLLAPGVFRPRQHEAVIALIFGLCVDGLIILIPWYVFGDLIPILFLVTVVTPVYVTITFYLLLKIRREEVRLLWSQAKAGYHRQTRQSIFSFIRRWSSLIALFTGAVILIMNPPPPQPTIELYASYVTEGVRISVVTTSREDEPYDLVIRSLLNAETITTRSITVRQATSPQDVIVTINEPFCVEIFRTGDNPATTDPLRMLSFPSQKATP